MYKWNKGFNRNYQEDRSVMKVNIWYSSHAQQWRWVLIDEDNNQESGGQEDLRTAMNDIANTIEYLATCKFPD